MVSDLRGLMEKAVLVLFAIVIAIKNTKSKMLLRFQLKSNEERMLIQIR